MTSPFGGAERRRREQFEQTLNAVNQSVHRNVMGGPQEIGKKLNELTAPEFRWKGRTYPQVEIQAVEGMANHEDVLWLEPRFVPIEGPARPVSLHRLTGSQHLRELMADEIWNGITEKDGVTRRDKVTDKERLILAAGFVDRLEEQHKEERRTAGTKIAALKRAGTRDNDPKIRELKNTRDIAERRLKQLPILRRAIKSHNLEFLMNDKVAGWGVRPKQK